MKKVLVIGGTGVLGTSVVNTLQQQQIEFVIGSRSQVKKGSYSIVNQSTDFPWKRVDLATGEGLAEALIGIDTVIHLASAPTKIGGEPFEVVTTRNLLKALNQSKAKHLIYSSIVGVDKVPFSYYRAKLAAEKLIQQQGIPYSILRATQFHDLINFLIRKLLFLPIGFVPKQLKFQPIHVDAVSSELSRLAQAGPQQTVLNLGGPQLFTLETMTRLWMKIHGKLKPLVPIPTIGGLMKSFEKGENTCPEKAVGSKTWEEYLLENQERLS
ncbi:NAD(P)H-binding protein [Spirosoma sp. BT702]|uniref:NAD(P)H-binding protein n=1 Tax=Spirosoma profusum TaxID=2771354 RepID=A0A926XVC3_9BACT|nr:NAD(P)H-binding protein [Spirosoma profusum]MBD2700396.1 NAD(P)H-binding protein [Spirosoma profusum]